MQDCLDQGTLLPDDLAYHEELEDWIPLSELVDSISTPESTPSAPSTEKPTLLSSDKPTTIEEKPSVKRCIVMGVLAFLFMSAPAAGQYWLLGTEDRFQKLNHAYMDILPAGEGLPVATEFCFSLTSWATKNTSIFLTGLFLLLLFCSVFMGGKRLYLSKKACKWINISFWISYMGIWFLYVSSLMVPFIDLMDRLGSE